MKKVRAAIVGYGNIGHYVLEALQAAPDFEIAGVVRRAGAENKPEELANEGLFSTMSNGRSGRGAETSERGISQLFFIPQMEQNMLAMTAALSMTEAATCTFRLRR